MQSQEMGTSFYFSSNEFHSPVDGFSVFAEIFFNSLINALSFDKDDAFFIYGVKDIKTTYKEKQ